MDTNEDSYLSQKESDDWDPRYGAPIRPPVAKRKCVSRSVQTSPIEEYYRPLQFRSTGSITSNSPDPESDGDDAGKRSLKRTNSGSGNHIAKKAKLVKPASPTKSATPKQPRRDTIITLDGTLAKPRSIYAPSPTPLQCTYVYPLALGPPRRPVDLRRNKGAKALPEVHVAPPTGAQAAKDGEATDAAAPADSSAMEIDLHKATHQCPITFSREFEMRRHIRTVHIAEEIRAVVEGRLPREQASVIPDNWDGKTLLSKPTCAGCGTTFSRPDAVRRHQTEVNAKMENGICVECPGPKVHIRRGPRKDVQPAQLPTPNPSPGPATLPAIAPAPAPASALGVAIAPAPAPVPVSTPVPSTAAAPASEAAPTPAIPTEPQAELATSGPTEPAEGELESEDDM